MKNGDEFARVHITPVGPNPYVQVMKMSAEVVFVSSQLPVAETLANCLMYTARALDRAETAVTALYGVGNP
jgi:enamine deaminase RidA (YjgF/YER057c/UK114 family)